jgi:glucose/arabinose dehydrogenase
MKQLVCALVLMTAQSVSALPVLAELMGEGFNNPVYVTAPPGDSTRLFVVEQPGRIMIIDVTTKTRFPFPFLDIQSVVNDSGLERGLLGLAFHPDYSSNGHFFVYYTGTGGETFVVRYTVSANPNAADSGSAAVFLRQTQPFPNHNGGMLAFRPGDNSDYLYVSLGDGGSFADPGNRGQDLTTKLGKILRIDVSSVPADPTVPNAPAANPFFDGAGGDQDSIWVYGLRNPWRFSFDRANGDMYIGDVGQDSVEEIDYQPAASVGGENYGWRLLEGSADFNCTTCDADRAATELPIHEYTHADGFSVTGGYVYRGSSAPSVVGVYFFADFNGRIWSFSFDGVTVSGFTEHTAKLNPQNGGISSFGEGGTGELFIVSYDGSIRRIIETNSPLAMPNQSSGGRSVLIVLMILGAILIVWRRWKWASK